MCATKWGNGGCVRCDNDLFVIRISAEDTINQYFVAKERKNTGGYRGGGGKVKTSTATSLKDVWVF